MLNSGIEKTYFSTDNCSQWIVELQKRLGYQIESSTQMSPSFFGSLSCARFFDTILAIVTISPWHLRGFIPAEVEPFYEFQLCDKGFGRIFQVGSTIRASPGRMICFDSEKPFDLTCNGQQFRLLIVRIPKRDLEGILGHYPTLTTRIISENVGLGEVAALYFSKVSWMLGTLSNEEAIFVTQSITALVKGLLLQLQMHSSSSASNLLFNRAKQIIDENLENSEISVAWIADKVGVSPSYLSSIFRKEGLSIMAFVKKLRLQKSCQLLREEPRAKIIEISDFCGFSCPSMFNHSFKEEYGISPSQYRLKFKNSTVKK